MLENMEDFTDPHQDHEATQNKRSEWFQEELHYKLLNILNKDKINLCV